ncbi:MAG: hypothetical protein ABSH44_21645 [Bryobacteraceae bacterium]
MAQLHRAREKFLRAQAEFRSFLAKMGQTSEGGFKIARALASTSRVPYSFFTRKALLEDAIAAYEDVHAVSVIKKPDPNPSLVAASQDLQDAYDKALEQSSGLVAGQIERAIARSSWWGRHGKTIIGFLLGVAASLVAAVVWWLGEAALGKLR